MFDGLSPLGGKTVYVKPAIRNLMLDNTSTNLRSPYWAVTRLAEKRVQDYNRGLEGLGAGNLIFQKILIIKASLHRFRGGMFLRGNVIK